MAIRKGLITEVANSLVDMKKILLSFNIQFGLIKRFVNVLNGLSSENTGKFCLGFKFVVTNFKIDITNF